MDNRLTMPEVIDFIERVGDALNWSTRYMDLAATAAGAVFRAENLNEKTDAIPVGEPVLEGQVARLSDHMARLGRSPKTATAYIGTWKRVSTLADGWLPIRGTVKEDYFWEGIDQFRDTRPSRRTRRSTPDEIDTTTGFRIEVALDDGVAVVSLPRRLTQAEAYSIIRAVEDEGAVEPA